MAGRGGRLRPARPRGERRVAWRLGPLGEGLEIGRVRLRWFEPGVVVEDLRLASPPAEDGRSVELLRLDSVHLSAGFLTDLRRPLERVRIEGGRVRISDELLEGLGRLGESDWEQGAGFGERRIEPPLLALSGLEIHLVLPGGEVLELGRADLLAEPSGEGGFRARGRLVPELSGAVAARSSVQIEGTQWEGGVRIQASARGIVLESTALAEPLTAYLPAELAGRLSLEASASLDWTRGLEAEGSLRASFEEARLVPRVGDPPVEDARVELSTTFRSADEGGLWAPASWSGTARLGARWLGSPVALWGRLGDTGEGDALAHLWGRARRLPLDRSLLSALHVGSGWESHWAALEPTGFADARLDVRVPRPAADGTLPRPRIGWHLRQVGESGMTFRGWPNEPEGEPQGFPVPCTKVTGHVLGDYHPAAERSWRVGLVDLEGDPGDGVARAEGMLAASPRGEGPTRLDLDLVLSVPRLAVDDTLRAGLAGNRGTSEIWGTYAPEGGRVSGEWRLHRSRRSGGLTAAGEVAVRGARLAWRELPVPFEEAAGRLTFRWAERPTPLRDLPGRGRRPFGFAYAFWNQEEDGHRPGVQGRVEGMAREETLRRATVATTDPISPWIQEISIDVPELLLRGRDWDVLAERLPEAGREIEALQAKGSARVSFHGARPAPTALYESRLEASPGVVELTPDFFPRRTRELEGRVLVHTVNTEAGTGEAEADVLLALTGRWPDGAAVAARGRVPAAGPATIRVLGAGIDPQNTVFKGAFVQALSGGEVGVAEGVSLSGQTIVGRLDFESLSEFDATSTAPPRNEHRVFLRDNDVVTPGFALQSLYGVLEQSDRVLFGRRIDARIVDHPVELENVLLFPLGEAARIEEADPILRRGGFWTDPEGLALQAELVVEDLPLDEAHLIHVLEPETLSLMRESVAWRGSIDILGARIVLTGEAGGQGKVAVHGKMRPHDLSMRLGVPIEVSSADVDLQELILEEGRVRGWGEIEDLDARIAGRELSDARTIVSYIDGRLTVDDLSGAFEGGRLSSLGGERGGGTALAVDLSHPYGFDLRVGLENVRVDRLLRGVFASTLADQGRLAVGLRLKGEPGRVLGITGDGWIRLDDGKLWSIPVMRELFNQLGFDETAIFDRMRARFQVRDGKIHTPEVRVQSTLLKLVGDGSLDFDGGLHYDLEVRYGLLDRLGALSKLLYWLNNSLWRVAVRGDMARPRVAIRNSLLEMIRGFRERPRRALPLPDLAPLPVRF